MSSESRAKYLMKNTVIFTLGNLATKLITFFLVPLYTYVLTTEEYGTVDLITTVSMVVAPVLMLNIGESVLRFSLDPNTDKNEVMSVGILCLLVAAVLGIFLIPCGNLIQAHQHFGTCLYLYVLSAAMVQIFLCNLRGQEKLLHFSVGNIINTACVGVLNILFLLYFHFGVYGYLGAYILSNMVTSIYAFSVGRVGKVLRNFHIDRNLLKRMACYSVVLIPNVFMWWIMNSADRIIVTAFLGVAANGVFAISYKIPSLLATISSIFNQAWSYSAIREDESSDKTEYTNRVYHTMFSMILFLASGMLLVVKPFLSIYVAPEFYYAWKYVPFLVIGFVFQSMATFLSTPYTVNFDSKGFLFSAAIGAVVNLVLNFLLVNRMGIHGVALATAISYITVFIYRAIDTRKYLRLQLFDFRTLVLLIIVLVMSGSIYLQGYWCYIALSIEFLVSFFMQLKMIKPMAVRLVSKIQKR